MLLIVDCDLFFPSTVIYSCALTLPFDFQVTFRPLYLILPTYMLLSYMYINIYIYMSHVYMCALLVLFTIILSDPPKKPVSKHHVYWSISYSACVATRWLHYVHSWSFKPPRCDNPRSKRLGGWKGEKCWKNSLNSWAGNGNENLNVKLKCECEICRFLLTATLKMVRVFFLREGRFFL